MIERWSPRERRAVAIGAVVIALTLVLRGTSAWWHAVEAAREAERNAIDRLALVEAKAERLAAGASASNATATSLVLEDSTRATAALHLRELARGAAESVGLTWVGAQLVGGPGAARGVVTVRLVLRGTWHEQLSLLHRWDAEAGPLRIVRYHLERAERTDSVQADTQLRATLDVAAAYRASSREGA